MLIMNLETYYENADCSNCNYQLSVKIPKGTPKNKFDIRNANCNNCGCKSLSWPR